MTPLSPRDFLPFVFHLRVLGCISLWTVAFGEIFCRFEKQCGDSHLLISLVKIMLYVLRLRGIKQNESRTVDMVKLTSWICTRLPVDSFRLTPQRHKTKIRILLARKFRRQVSPNFCKSAKYFSKATVHRLRTQRWKKMAGSHDEIVVSSHFGTPSTFPREHYISFCDAW
jgi:hypothetical protein